MEGINFLNIQYVFFLIYRFFKEATVGDFASRVLALLGAFIEYITPISIVLSLVLLTGIVYFVIRIKQIRDEEYLALYGATEIPEPAGGEADVLKNEQWEHVQELIASENANDWRAAIIEADIMLDEMITRMGYEGESLGEKMKQIERSDFLALDKAWEAHKARNAIAHEGAGFTLTKRQAQRIIDLYKQAFEEFHFI